MAGVSSKGCSDSYPVLGQDFHGPWGWEVTAVNGGVTTTTPSSLLTGRRFGKDMGQDASRFLFPEQGHTVRVQAQERAFDVGCEPGPDTKPCALGQLPSQAKDLVNGAGTVGFDHGVQRFGSAPALIAAV